MPYLLPINARPDPIQHFAFKDEVFTPDECQAIIALGDKYEWRRAKTLGGEENDPRRRSDVAWLPWGSPEESWIFERLSHWVVSLNAQFFGFDLNAFGEAFQITRYDAAERGYYSWHQDFGPGIMSVRKLSFVVQLTDPNAYTGGDLEVFMAKIEKNVAIPRAQGAMVVFPAYEPHRVVPMKSGIRHSLVGWVSGTPFR